MIETARVNNRKILFTVPKVHFLQFSPLLFHSHRQPLLPRVRQRRPKLHNTRDCNSPPSLRMHDFPIIGWATHLHPLWAQLLRHSVRPKLSQRFANSRLVRPITFSQAAHTLRVYVCTNRRLRSDDTQEKQQQGKKKLRANTNCSKVLRTFAKGLSSKWHLFVDEHRLLWKTNRPKGQIHSQPTIYAQSIE